VDFGVFKYEEQGRERKLYAFVMVMSYSKAMYVEFVTGRKRKSPPKRAGALR